MKIHAFGRHVLLYSTFIVYSLSSILSKLAGQQPFLSVQFILLYGGLLCLLFLYALLWQQVLKCFPLTVAFANKSVVIPLGMLWGWLIFGEEITWKMMLGVGIIVIGVCVVVSEHEQ